MLPKALLTTQDHLLIQDPNPGTGSVLMYAFTGNLRRGGL